MAKLVCESLEEFGKKPDTKAWKVLEFIGSKGEEGASLTEIQHFIWTELQGKSEEDFWKKGQTWGAGNDEQGNMKKVMLRQSRGHWNDALYNTESTKGLLNGYCHKNDKHKWVLDKMPKPGESIFKSNYR